MSVLQQNAELNAAKHNAKCSKTQCYLQQNATLNGAKREAKWCKTQSKQVQNTGRGGVYNLQKTTNNRLLRTENCLKICFLAAKSCFWGNEKSWTGNQIERLNGAKRGFLIKFWCKNKMRGTKNWGKMHAFGLKFALECFGLKGVFVKFLYHF